MQYWAITLQNNCSGNQNGFAKLMNSHSHPTTFHTIRLEDISQIIWTSFENKSKKLNGMEIISQNTLIRELFITMAKIYWVPTIFLRISNPSALISQVLCHSCFMPKKTGVYSSHKTCSKPFLVRGKAGT